jgi:hypothetical protein
MILFTLHLEGFVANNVRYICLTYITDGLKTVLSPKIHPYTTTILYGHMPSIADPARGLSHKQL